MTSTSSKTGNTLIQLLCNVSDRVTNKLVPLDICHILLLNIHEAVAPTTANKVQTCRFLTLDEVARYSLDHAADLDDKMHQHMQQQHLRCFGALAGEQLLGYCWVADGHVSPEHNSGGHPFSGFGLQLEPSASYLFKCFVLPDHRGQRINQQLAWQLAQTLIHEGKSELIATTSWVNWAFQSSSRQVGFTKIGMAAEWRILGKSFYNWSNIRSYGFQLTRPEARTAVSPQPH